MAAVAEESTEFRRGSGRRLGLGGEDNSVGRGGAGGHDGAARRDRWPRRARCHGHAQFGDREQWRSGGGNGAPDLGFPGGGR